MFFAALLLMAGLAAAAPCSKGCIEPFPMGEERAVMMYRSHSLKGHGGAQRALIVLHGAGRNADEYFQSGMAAAFLAGGLGDTVVVAPRFAGCGDKLSAGELEFACSGNDWRGGGPAVGYESVTTYDVMDALIQRFADKKRFPKLRQVVLMGHSAGGQFMSRYAASSRVDPEGLSVRYVVSNPSSYLYLDAWRPRPVAGCAGFNAWKYGMERRTGYAAELGDAGMRENLLRRDVVYLLGEYDVTPQFGFDSSCGAMVQGVNRLERGLDYYQYVLRLGARHRLVRVPNCGHNGRCMLVADEAREILFQ